MCTQIGYSIFEMGRESVFQPRSTYIIVIITGRGYVNEKKKSIERTRRAKSLQTRTRAASGTISFFHTDHFRGAGGTVTLTMLRSLHLILFATSLFPFCFSASSPFSSFRRTDHQGLIIHQSEPNDLSSLAHSGSSISSSLPSVLSGSRNLPRSKDAQSIIVNYQLPIRIDLFRVQTTPSTPPSLPPTWRTLPLMSSSQEFALNCNNNSNRTPDNQFI